MQYKIPLMDLFLEFQAEAAAEHTRQLGQLAAEVAGHPVLLSANAGLPNKTHTYVVKYLTHVICEVGQNAPAGTKQIDHAIEAYELATTLGKPLAATASGQDWAFVKQNNCEELVRFWVALAYAYGQRFMAPHPQRQWCFNDEAGDALVRRSGRGLCTDVPLHSRECRLLRRLRSSRCQGPQARRAGQRAGHGSQEQRVQPESCCTCSIATTIRRPRA